MKNLEVGTKVDFYEVVNYKNGVYTLSDGYNTVTIDMEAKKVSFVERNNRCYKAEKFTKSFNFLIASIEELEEEVEEVENLTDDLFQESDIAYAEEAIQRETAEVDEEVQEDAGELQDVVVNLYDGHIGRVVGMRVGKYRIVMSTGKLVELDRNEFYLDNEKSSTAEIKNNVTTFIKIGYYNYEVFENEYVIRFNCKALDREFIYNKKFKHFKLLQISTDRFLSAKRYYNNYYNIIGQLHEYVNKGA